MTSLYDNDFTAWVAAHHERISEVLADKYSSVKVITVKGEHWVATFTRRGGWFDLDVPPWMDGWRILWDLKTFIKAHRRLTA